MEGRIDRGEWAVSARARGVATFGQFIDVHVADMKEVDKAPGRSKDATLAMLRRELGSVTGLSGSDRPQTPQRQLTTAPALHRTRQQPLRIGRTPPAAIAAADLGEVGPWVIRDRRTRGRRRWRNRRFARPVTVCAAWHWNRPRARRWRGQLEARLSGA
jgi:hypothetical protein